MMAQEIDDHIMDPQPVWQGNPDRDFLIFRLIDLAESIATWFFTEADLGEYQRWRKAASRRKAKASLEPFECVRWKDAVHGILELHAQPRPGTFSLWCGSGLYEATVDFSFDENDYQISSAAVRSFAGDINIGLDAVDGWQDTIIQIDAPYDGNDTELMLARLLDAANARPGRAESGLAPPTREDERQVQVLANAVASRFAKRKHTELYGDGKAYVESRPQCIWPILEGALAAFTTDSRNEHLISAYLYLLTHELETIRYKLETGTPWAKPLLDTFQARITALAASPDMDPRDCAVLAKTIVDAKVDVDTSSGEALMNRAPPDAIEQGGDPAEALRPLLDQMAGSVSDSFELIEVLTETTSIMPPQMRAMIGFELGLSPHAVMRDAVPLLLIDPQTDVRQAAAAVLEKTAAPATLSPVALRQDNPDIRAIALGKGTSDQQTERVRKQVLGPRRPYWATLFLLLAARAQAAIKPKDGVDFPDFLIMARELAGDRPLSDIPLMLGLAYRSLMIAQQSA